MEKVLLTQKELAEALGVHQRTMNRWIAQDPNFPSYSTVSVKRRKYLLKEVLDYLKDKKDDNGNEES